MHADDIEININANIARTDETDTWSKYKHSYVCVFQKHHEPMGQTLGQKQKHTHYYVCVMQNKISVLLNNTFNSVMQNKIFVMFFFVMQNKMSVLISVLFCSDFYSVLFCSGTSSHIYKCVCTKASVNEVNHIFFDKYLSTIVSDSAKLTTHARDAC